MARSAKQASSDGNDDNSAKRRRDESGRQSASKKTRPNGQSRGASPHEGNADNQTGACSPRQLNRLVQMIPRLHRVTPECLECREPPQPSQIQTIPPWLDQDLRLYDTETNMPLDRCRSHRPVSLSHIFKTQMPHTACLKKNPFLSFLVHLRQMWKRMTLSMSRSSSLRWPVPNLSM